MAKFKQIRDTGANAGKEEHLLTVGGQIDATSIETQYEVSQKI